MEVILEKDVKKLGYRGEVVTVKPGYFRNFLFPRGLANVATPSARKLAEVRNQKMVMAKQQVVENAKEVVDKVNGLTIKLTESANDKGHLYAAVSESEVVAAIAGQAKVELDPAFVKMDQVKEVGEYKIAVEVGAEKAEITLVVEAA